MSTRKHIDKICISVVSITLVITILFMCGCSLGISVKSQSMPYESKLFDNSYVHSIDIVMNDWDTFIENCESEEYSMCTVVIDGQKHSDIAIRAKGNTSLTTVSTLGSDRYSFKLEFDHYDSSKSLDGLDKLCLNNLIQDNTMMKDYLVYQLMNDFGVDSPLCSFAYLTVNGEDWGLYLAVEGIEDSFLSRNYDSEIGDLYKPDSISNGGGRGNGKNFNMDDFDFGNTDFGDTDFSDTENQGNQQNNQQSPPRGQGGFNPNGQGGQGSFIPGNNEQPGGMQGGGMGSDDVKLKYIDDDPDSYSNIFSSAKTNVTSADEKRLIQALKNLSTYTDLENTVDIEEVIRYFVIHNFVCNGDSYTGSMIHNYYLYEEDGILSMIPWDYNLAYGTFQGSNASETVNSSIDSPVSGGNVDDRPMLGWIFSSEEYTELYHQLFSEFLQKWFTNGELEKMISETAELIRPYVEKDPTKFCTVEEFDAGVTALSQFVSLRAQAVGKQLNGDNTQVDTGSLNLTDMGTMNNGIGGEGEMNVPDMKDMNLLSFVTLKDKNGNSFDITTVIPSTATVVSVTLSDNSTVNLTSTDMQTLIRLDVSKIVSATDSDGNIYDLSSYTISKSMPNNPNGQGGNGDSIPSMPDSQGRPGGDQNGFPDSINNGGQMSNGDGRNGQMNPDDQSAMTDTTSEATKWIYVGASVLSLAVGVFIAIKYNRI